MPRNELTEILTKLNGVINKNRDKYPICTKLLDNNILYDYLSELMRYPSIIKKLDLEPRRGTNSWVLFAEVLIKHNKEMDNFIGGKKETKEINPKELENAVKNAIDQVRAETEDE